MINSVRNTVLSVLNKNNYGYITPSDFNLLAKQAQHNLFVNMINEYNMVVTKENLRRSGTGYANSKWNVEMNIEEFLVTGKALTPSSNNVYYMPSLATTGDVAFNISKVLCYRIEGENKIFLGEADKISNNKISLLNNSTIVSPSERYPVFSVALDKMTIYPASISGAGAVEADYIRFPKDPKWTYISIGNGEPVFDQSQSDYQDFEIGIVYENKLVLEILALAGIEIRELQVAQFADSEQNSQNQQAQQ